MKVCKPLRYDCEEAKELVGKALTNEWAGAVEIASNVSLPWRLVARTLRLLTEAGEAERSEEVRIAPRYRKRVKNLFRATPYAKTNRFPTWLQTHAAPVQSKVRVVRFGGEA